MKWNRRQRKAIEADIDKNICVIGPAGTGKTGTIEGRCHWLASSVERDKIRLITFTNKAADEIEERLPLSTPNNVSTYSSWCYTELRGSGCDIDLFDDEKDEQRKFVKKIVGDEFDVDKLIQLIGYCANKQMKVKEAVPQRFKHFAGKEKQLQKVITEYETAKSKSGNWDFDDLLTNFYEQLKDKSFLKKLVAKTHYLLVDEAQDLSVIQWKILRKLAKNGVRLFCVGDPCQNIYSFRGASGKYLEQFEKRFSNSKVVELQKNYRSSQEIVGISNWLRLIINDSYHEVKATKGSSLAPLLISEEGFESSMEILCECIGRLLEEGSQVEEIAVLVRTNKQIKQVGKVLVKENVPVANEKGSSGVELLTMHGSKGKGFKHVFVIDPRFGYSELDTKYCEQRLLYVALTRAKSSLTIVQSIDGKALYSDAKKGTYPIDEMTRPLLEIV